MPKTVVYLTLALLGIGESEIVRKGHGLEAAGKAGRGGDDVGHADRRRGVGVFGQVRYQIGQGDRRRLVDIGAENQFEGSGSFAQLLEDIEVAIDTLRAGQGYALPDQA